MLAPSSRDAKRQNEPLGVSRLRWDAATPRLYAYLNPYPYYEYPKLVCEFSWTPQSKAWQSYPIKEAPWLVVSQGDEAMLVWAKGEMSVFEFVKTGQKVTAAVPVPSTIGEPAWDQTRIWVPTCSGLYEVDRATGNVHWVAYQEGNPFFALLKADGRPLRRHCPRTLLLRHGDDRSGTGVCGRERQAEGLAQ